MDTAPQPENDQVPQNEKNGTHKAEVCYRLAERAWNRFESRRNMEWRTAAAIWTAFALGTALVLTAGDWTPGWPEIIGAGLLALSCIVGYYFWVNYANQRSRQENQTSYFWESHLRKMSGARLPKQLEPPGEKSRTRTWLEFFHLNKDLRMERSWPSADQCASDLESDLVLDWELAPTLNYLVAVLLACLFFAAVTVRSCRESREEPPAAKLMLEGRSLEIDTLSQLKLGHETGPEEKAD